MRFRPCIDLHGGVVKQIICSSLQDNDEGLQTNFVASQSPAYFAGLYRADGLSGGHVIMLGPGNESAAREALAAYPGGLQIGGGITADNAREWLAAGADKVIITSYIFPEHEFSLPRLQALGRLLPPDQLVLDLSCRRRGDEYVVACNRWQNDTSLLLQRSTLQQLSVFCSEFLIHAVDVEGKQSGIDLDLVKLLAQDCPLPVTYAGGIRSLADIEAIRQTGQGRIDFTVGSALDIFGGKFLRYADLRKFCQ